MHWLTYTCINTYRQERGQQRARATWLQTYSPSRNGKGSDGRVDPPQGARGQSMEPHRIVKRPWNLMGFALLGFELYWDPWSFFLQTSPFWNENVCLCLSHHCISEGDDLFSSVTGSLMGEFCPIMDHTQSLTCIWFRWFRQWYLELSELLHLDATLDLELMLEYVMT